MKTWMHSGRPSEESAYATHMLMNADHTELTPNGTPYFVSSSLEHGDRIVPVVDTVVVSARIRPDLRARLASVGINSLADDSPRCVADALKAEQDTIRADAEAGADEDNDDMLTHIPDHYALHMGAVVAKVLLHHKSVADRRGQQYGHQTVDPHKVIAIRRGLGYAQANRLPEHHETVLALLSRGLWPQIPWGETGNRLVVPMRTHRGNHHEIGMYHTVEMGETHSCAGCSGYLQPGESRVTHQLPNALSVHSDHEHMDANCTANKLVTYGKLEDARIEPIPSQRLQYMGTGRPKGGVATYIARYNDYKKKVTARQHS